MGNYEEAKRFNGELRKSVITFVAYVLTFASCTALLLEKEPSNLQAQSLSDLIESKIQQGAWRSIMSPPAKCTLY